MVLPTAARLAIRARPGAAQLSRSSALTSTARPTLPPYASSQFAASGRVPAQLQLARGAANKQSGKPASDNWTHTAQNIKEETSQVRSSLEEAVSGANQTTSQLAPTGTEEILKEAKTITGEMAQAMPQPALIWGAAGVVPYVSTAGASIYLARQEALVSQGVETGMDVETASALLLHAQNIQVGFGAVLLSFLGAIHWGFEFSRYGGTVGNTRYALGVAPVIMAWPTLLLSPQVALAAQWAAYVAVWFGDLRATSAGWTPKWYSTYRFWLTAFVGTSIIATLAGTNYYAPGSRGTAVGGKLLDEVKEDAGQKMKLMKQSARGNKGGALTHNEVKGDVEALSSGAEGDSYVKIDNPKRRAEEERKKKEEEEAKKKKEAEEKKKKEEDEKKGGDDKGEKKEGGNEKGEKKKDEGGEKEEGEGEKKEEGEGDK